MSSLPNRRPYHGSCHCGKIRYVAFVSLPPTVGPKVDPRTTVRFYKCNCTTCHKFGIFHMRVPNPPEDFYLLSPNDPSQLSSYSCNDRLLDWYFCPDCGTRCFTVGGKGKNEDVDLEAALGKPSEGKKTTVWKTITQEPTGPGRNYLSINVHSIDQGQEGFDMRNFVDEKWVEYLDCKEETNPPRYDRPQEGGTW